MQTEAPADVTGLGAAGGDHGAPITHLEETSPVFPFASNSKELGPSRVDRVHGCSKRSHRPVIERLERRDLKTVDPILEWNRHLLDVLAVDSARPSPEQ